MKYFFEGLVIGLAIAAPVGPIGVLCIQRSLEKGFRVGFITGLGAALADGVYGLIAAFSITTITSFLIIHQFWIRIIGGLFLIYLGIKSMIASHNNWAGSKVSSGSLWKVFSSTFFLTLTNPTTIISFLAIFAGIGIEGMHTYWYASLAVLGIILGSASWWFLLSGGIAYILKKHLNPSILKGINLLSGIIILAFGLVALSYGIGT